MNKPINRTVNWWRTDMGEAEKSELLKAFSEKRFTISSSVHQVETLVATILNVPYVVMTNSGSSALLMSLMALDIQSDDEIIVPSLTWIATPQAARILNAKVIACDTLQSAPIIDSNLIEPLITRKTKAIMPVHYNGRYCDMEAINTLAKKHNLAIVEDSCKGLFSSRNGLYLGTMGDIGCFSLGMISPISVGFGGILVTRNLELYEKLKLIRDHGVIRNPESYATLGFNFKISDLLASLAVPQLLNHKAKINSLIKLHNYYQENIDCDALRILEIEKNQGSVPVYVEGYSENREEIIDYITSHGIQVSRFHNPIHTAKYLKCKVENLENSTRFANNTFILPSGPSQEIQDIDFVLEVLNKF